jgi:hypothetical protein
MIGITISQADGSRTPHSLAPGAALLLTRHGTVTGKPAEADVTLYAGDRGQLWAALSPAAASVARAGGRVVLGRLADISVAPLVLDGRTIRLDSTPRAPRVCAADKPGACPVCGQEIAAGDDVLRCACGLTVDSAWCLRAGSTLPRCYACGLEHTIGGQS